MTCPQDSEVAFPTGSVVYIARINTGSLNIAAGTGATISQTGSFGAGEELYVRKRAANTWFVVAGITTISATGGTLSSSGGYDIHTFTSSGNFVAG